MNRAYKYGMECGIAFVLMLFACRRETALEQALTLSGKNRGELEKVLDHFRGDSLKYKAACFLIENMPGAFGIDSSVIDACAPFYEEYDLLSHTFDYDSVSHPYTYSRGVEWGEKVDSLWDAFSSKNFGVINKKWWMDIEHIPASRLITEIDQSFCAWRENVYTRNCSFDDFCEYILPYRRINGLVIDSARQVFYARHHGHFFDKPGKNMIDEADSLLYFYRDWGHSRFYGTKIPLWNAATFEKLRHGLCEHRCWYNSLLFSSLGMEVAIDFIPAWGNRNNSHTWNVLIKDGKSYAFEAFWDEDRWKYKRIYNNISYDEGWGCFRLAKVYRRTYRRYVEGPLANKDVHPEDIPELFKNVRKKDVSQEYFKTADVVVPLRKIPAGTKYAYLCVLNYNEWQPVQWGKIKGGSAIFKGMGKGIAYLPMYCINGVMQIASDPFILKSDGRMRALKPGIEKQKIVVNHFSGALFYADNKNNNKNITGSVLLGGKYVGKFKDTLCVFPKNIWINSQYLKVLPHDSIRYIRMKLPNKNAAIGDLKFYKKDGNSEKRLKNVCFIKEFLLSQKGESALNMLDSYSSTGYKALIREGYMDFDLGEYCLLSRISFCPYLEWGFVESVSYELCYWQNGWHSLGKVMGGKLICFDNVPQNALLLIKPGNNSASRPFIYEGGEMHWY